MHEMSLASEILDLIERSLGRPEPLGSVSLVLGPLSGVSAGSLEFCFSEMASQRGFGYPLLLITHTLALVRCTGCGEEYQTGDFAASCQRCGHPGKHILTGRECSVESVETLEE